MAEITLGKMQDQMRDICMEYAGNRPDAVYVYCYAGDDVRHVDCAFLINEKFLKKHELNEVFVSDGHEPPIKVQKALCRTLDMAVDTMKVKAGVFPVQIRLVYCQKNKQFFADYLFGSTDNNVTEDIGDIAPLGAVSMPEAADAWFREKTDFFMAAGVPYTSGE